MIRPDFAKWGQVPDDIFRLSLEAEHPRSRERFQALNLIGIEQTNAMSATGVEVPKSAD